MDPVLIESHTGMKVLTSEEYEKLSKDLEESRGKIREMNNQVQQKYSEVLKTSMEIQSMKKDIEQLKEIIDEKKWRGNLLKGGDQQIYLGGIYEGADCIFLACIVSVRHGLGGWSSFWGYKKNTLMIWINIKYDVWTLYTIIVTLSFRPFHG